MSETSTGARERAFAMWRSMMAGAGEDATIVDFRAGYDSMFAEFELDPTATVTEVNAGGVRCLKVDVGSTGGVHAVYFHGGGYMCGNPEGVVSTAARIARASEATVYVPDYRLAPEHAHPAAHDDGVAVIRWLLAGDAAADQLAVVGDSAGGGLALSTIVGLQRAGEPLPAAVCVWSPWVDMKVEGATLVTYAAEDPIASAESLTMSSQAYLQGQDSETPTAHILGADLAGFPPLLIEVGGVEVLLDDSLRLARKAALAGVDVTLHVAPGVPHVYQYFAEFLPEGQRSIELTGRFIRERVARS